LPTATCGRHSLADAQASRLDPARLPTISTRASRRDTFARFTYLPVLRGLAALHRRQPGESVERLQTRLQYELAVNGLSLKQYLGGLYSAYAAAAMVRFISPLPHLL
jgi:hypothetical protein